MSTQRYSETEIAAVGKWLKDGFSASQIAAALKGLGTEATRNAVVSLVNRNKTLKQVGFARAPGGGSPRKASKAAAPKPTGQKPSGLTLMPARAFLASKDDLVNGENPLGFRMPIHRPRAEGLGDPAAYDRGSRRVPLADLGSGCRWPVNDVTPPEPHLFCGHPRQPGFSYCRHHRLRSVQCR